MTSTDDTSKTKTAPLAGLKVVDLSRILAGPFAGQTLSDLGAEVIKVEAPNGDDTRRWGPPFIDRSTPDGGSETSAVYFHAANRGKSSVVCDLTNADDLKRLKTLISEADILIENFKVGGLAKYGLDYPTLSNTNPGLIYASITGFGQDGPRATENGYDYLMQGMTGIMDVTGPVDGEPQKVGVAWIDVFTGLYAVIAIQAALIERQQSGLGQHIDLSLFDTGLGVLANQAATALLSDQKPRRLGNGHPNIVPYQVFPTSDGHIIIACGNDRQFRGLCEVLDLADLADDLAFATNPNRVANRIELTRLLDDRTQNWSKSDLIDALKQAGVPAGPINTVNEALADIQTVARGMIIEPEGIASVRSPIRFSRSRLSVERASPVLGSGEWAFSRDTEGK